MVDPVIFFSFHPLGVTNAVACTILSGMVHIKDPLNRADHEVAVADVLSLSDWSFTMWPAPYNCKINVLSVLLNKTFPSFLQSVVPVREVK